MPKGIYDRSKSKKKMMKNAKKIVSKTAEHYSSKRNNTNLIPQAPTAEELSPSINTLSLLDSSRERVIALEKQMRDQYKTIDRLQIQNRQLLKILDAVHVLSQTEIEDRV